MAKIYTKVGDKGQTSLVGGQKVSKSDPRIEAYGTIDELNSVLGIVRTVVDRNARQSQQPDSLFKLAGDLEQLQHWLFDLGSILASLPEDREKFALPPVRQDQIRWLEERIDGATAILAPLRNFILPGGDEAAAHLHFARTVARRAERHLVAMSEIPENAIPFVNRISDYLFTMARLVNHYQGIEDVLWKKT